jgi:hypothetical protein
MNGEECRIPIAFVARGELTIEDLEFTMRFLGKQGLSTEIIDEPGIPNSADEDSRRVGLSLPSGVVAAETEILISPYYFSQITSGNQFLIREHFWEFRDQFAKEFTELDAGRALSAVLHPQKGPNQPWSARLSLDPADLGLVVKARDELGFQPAPPQTFNVEAIQIAGLINLVERPEVLRELFGMTLKREDFLNRLVSQLKKQIDLADIDSQA